MTNIVQKVRDDISVIFVILLLNPFAQRIKMLSLGYLEKKSREPHELKLANENVRVKVIHLGPEIENRLIFQNHFNVSFWQKLHQIYNIKDNKTNQKRKFEYYIKKKEKISVQN